ncbi:hypothetical protein PoB_003193100 [Plakobranchus ocellatus]|uniref:Uncharacterized protein n=1 Tax=Plakobranchus ocellatus TaxID=259542 RepID=A0AAV4A2H3_9GAST|nr:hypothetical protein PoB_003193100 [Plakobranchus ocellatus]
MAITQASRTCPETPQHHQDSTQGSATSDLWYGRVRPLDEYQRFGEPKDVWYSYTGKQQKRHMKEFTITTKERLVRSTNSEKAYCLLPALFCQTLHSGVALNLIGGNSLYSQQRAGCGTANGIEANPIQRKLTSRLGSVGQRCPLVLGEWNGQGGMLMTDSHNCQTVTT